MSAHPGEGTSPGTDSAHYFSRLIGSAQIHNENVNFGVGVPRAKLQWKRLAGSLPAQLTAWGTQELLSGGRHLSQPGKAQTLFPLQDWSCSPDTPCCLFAPCWKLHKLSFFSLLCHKGELFSKSTSSALWFWSKKHQCSAIFYQTSAITPQTTLPTRKPLRILHRAENYSENYNQENFISYGIRCKTQDLNSFWRASPINKRHKHSLTVWFLGGTYKKMISWECLNVL